MLATTQPTLSLGSSLRQDNSPPIAGSLPARDHRVLVGSPQVIAFTERDGRITRRLMWPVRVHPSVDADMPILRWTDKPATESAVQS